jgi:hypothetical protein
MAGEPTKQVPPKTDSAQPKHGGVAWPLWLLMLFPFVYFLSIGPVLKLSRHTSAYQVARNAYNPLFFSAEHCPPLQTCLDSYLHAWHIRNPRHHYE